MVEYKYKDFGVPLPRVADYPRTYYAEYQPGPLGAQGPVGPKGFAGPAGSQGDTGAAGGSDWIELEPGANDFLDLLMGTPVAGQRYWLKPGTYHLSGVLAVAANYVTIAGTREALVVLNDSSNEFQLTGDAITLSNFTIRIDHSGLGQAIEITGDDVLLDRLEITRGASAGLRVNQPVRVHGTAARTVVRRCYFYQCASEAAVFLVTAGGGTRILENDFDLGTVTDASYVYAVQASSASSAPDTQVCGNRINLGAAAYRGGVWLASEWDVSGNEVIGGNVADQIAFGANGATDCRVQRNRAVTCNQALDLVTVSRWLIAHNIFSGRAAYGGFTCYFYSDSGVVEDLLLVGNRFIESAIGFSLLAGGTAIRRIALVGNVVLPSPTVSVGLRALGQSGTRGDAFVLAGNVFDEASGDTVLLVNWDHYAIAGNVVKAGVSCYEIDQAAHGAISGNVGEGDATCNGIYLLAGSSYVAASGNSVYDGITANFGVRMSDTAINNTVFANITPGITRGAGAGHKLAHNFGDNTHDP